MDELIVVRDLRKSFSDGPVISGISFELKRGEVLGIVGPNGAGKSTLLRIIAGIIEADSGTVEVRGKIGYTPQDNLLLPWFNLEENILLAAKLSGVKEREAMERLASIAEKLGIGEHLKKRVRDVSGGTARKAAIARSLIISPDILILDEPYTGLDRDSIDSLQSSLKRLREERMGMIIVSHQLGELTEISDRVIVLSHRPAKIVKEISWRNGNISWKELF
ncbi:MAG: ABC transporter ATP-binding protein [Fervidicoccaceae archaeon]